MAVSSRLSPFYLSLGIRQPPCSYCKKPVFVLHYVDTWYWYVRIFFIRAERSHSGRVRLLGKQVSAKADREFESRPLRSGYEACVKLCVNGMQKMIFSINIEAPRKKVWDTLWDDTTFRDWGNIIDEGQYMVGEVKEGNEVQFMSSSGYGVTSLIEKLIPNEFVLIRQRADTQNSGKQAREKEWTGGTESYSLKENNNSTTLKVSIDVPSGLEELFQDRFPRALGRVKELAENKK